MEDVKRPKILFLGNGILQAFGGEAWRAFLKSLNPTREGIDALIEMDCPAPLKAILVTDDHIDVAMKTKCDQLLSTPVLSGELVEMLQGVLSMGFDHIFTTNYTYEIEQAAVYPKSVTRYHLNQIATSTIGRCEAQYLIHTYNRVVYGGVENRVWHLHGEAKKPNSTILGHYYYGSLLFQIKKEIDTRIEKHGLGMPDEMRSWVEAFLYGDIYCLGFGYDLSESDLWWLLNRKAREKHNRGKFYFYEPRETEGKSAKIMLMEILRQTTGGEGLVEVLDMGYERSRGDQDWDFKPFYMAALADVQARINK